MKCLNPLYTHGETMIPCRQCPNCRVNAKRIWSSRIQLENLWHPYGTFVTLTYRDDDIPLTAEITPEGDTTDRPIPTLDPAHLMGFIKKLRNALRSQSGSIRYFACGEYGDLGEAIHGHGRPHYHLIVWGITALDEQWLEDEIWDKGFVECGDITTKRCSYVAGYTVKKMTKSDDLRLKGRWPEFARMSTGGMHGGIGAPSIPWLAQTMGGTRAGQQALEQNGDVWNAVRIEGKLWPLGNFMRRKLRDQLAIPQCSRERAAMFKQYTPDGELKIGKILPDGYAPHQDATAIRTPWRNHAEAQANKKAIPDLTKQAEKRLRREEHAKRTGATHYL